MKLLLTLTLSLIFVVTVVSCTDDDAASAPIAPKEMQALLLDIHIAEYYSQGLGKHKGTYMKEYDSLAKFYTSIFAHHKIDMDQFYEAIDWYKKRPVLLDSIYVNIKEEATAMQDAWKVKINTGASVGANTTKKAQSNLTTDTASRSANSRKNILPSSAKDK